MKPTLFPRLGCLALIVLAISACDRKAETADSMTTKSGLNPKDFVTTIGQKETALYTLSNEDGLEVCLTNYGARIVSLMVPDRQNQWADVVLGFSSIKGYLKANEIYHGATIGRYANRIAGGRFSLEGEEYVLTQNNGTNSLHGGPNGFHNQVWDVVSASPSELKMTLISPDGEEGFPGALNVTVSYALNEVGELSIAYFANTDKTTVVNLTHHSFFNLRGEGSGTINDHLLFIEADEFSAVDENLIPTGNIAVAGTPFDFRVMRPIGDSLSSDHAQITRGRGYDHNFVLSRYIPENERIRFVAEAREPVSGRWLKVFTNEPGVQFYGGNFLDGSDSGKSGRPYGKRTAFCLETQHFPDSPNNVSFPSTVLYPGQTYKSNCIYKFGVE